MEGDQEVMVNSRLAVCYTCNTITTAEILPENDHPNFPDYEAKKKLLSERSSPAKCLNCGEHNFELIPFNESDEEKRKQGPPYETGLVHRNCGGMIYGKVSGPNFYMGNRLPQLYFDIEGNFIKELFEIEE